MNHSRSKTRQDALDAETVAIHALTFLAADLERLERFLALTGLSPDEVRAAAGDPGFLAAVLEHTTQDETLLMTFSANAGIAPEAIEAARIRLGRGHDPARHYDGW